MKLPKITGILGVVAATALAGGFYLFVSVFTSNTPLIHFVIVWALWLFVSASVNQAFFMFLIPFVAFLVAWVPVPNYWASLASGDFRLFLSDLLDVTGVNDNSSEGSRGALANQLFIYTAALLSVTVAGISMRSVIARGKLPV